MAGPIEGPMAAALAADRDRFNGLFHQARRGSPDLDDGRFARSLAELAQPVVVAAEAAVPGSAPAVTAAAYEVMLDLAARKLTGDGSVLLAWRTLLPALAGPIGRDPAGVLGPLTNAVWNLTATVGPRPAEWVPLMLAVGAEPDVDAEALRTAGLVAAWRSGLAHAREAALIAAGELPAGVAAAALGLADPPKDLGPVLARLAEDRWAEVSNKARKKAGRIEVVGRVGGFRGFGGPFVTTPRVATDGVGILVRSGPGDPAADEFWDLHADRFGATLTRRPAPTVEPIEPAAGRTLLIDGTATIGSATAAVPELAAGRSWTATADTIAATTNRTYSVILLAEV